MAQIEGPFGPPDAACGDVDKSGLVCGNLCTAIAELGSRLLRIEKLHLYTAEEGYVPFSVSSSQMGIDFMVGSSIVHLPKHSSVHHPVAQMVLFAIMSNNDFYCPRSMVVPKPILDITQQFGPDSCGTDVPTVYEALWVSAKIRSANARNGSAISDACGTVRKDLLSLPVLFDVSMKCEKMKSKVPESNKLPGNCCNGYTHAVPGVGPSLQLCALVKGEMNYLVCSHDAYPLVNSMEKSGCLLGSCNVPEIISDTVTSHNLQFAPSNAGTGSDFIQLHSHPDGSVSSEEHQYILNNLGHEQNHLLCAFEQPICCSKYSKGQEVLICDTESPCLSVGGRATLNSSEEWHGSQAYLLATPQSLASDGSSSSTSTSPPLLWLDSGASHHAVGDDRILCNFQDPPAGAAVRVADGFRLLVTKVGEIQTENFQIPDVYLVPGLQMNVISVRQLAKSKIIPTFYENHAELWREGELVGGAIADDETSLYGLYYLIGTGNNAAALTS